MLDGMAHQLRARRPWLRAIATSSGSVGLPSRRSSPTFLPSALGVAFVVEHVVDQLEGGAQRAAVVGAGLFDVARRRRPAPRPGGRWPRTAWPSCSGSRAGSRRPPGRGRACSSAAAPRPRRSRWWRRPAPPSPACGSTPTIIWKAREYRKSPTSTLAALPNSALAVLLAAAQRRLVDHVVVQQRGGVDELDDGGQLVALGPVEAQRLGEQQHQRRPHALAAGADDVVRDLVDQRHLRGQARAG